MDDIKIRKYYLLDSNGRIKQEFHANTKKLSYRPDGSQWWVLEHVDAVLDNNLWFDYTEQIVFADCHLDPDMQVIFKIKEGEEEAFEFFQKNGYSKPEL